MRPRWFLAQLLLLALAGCQVAGAEVLYPRGVLGSPVQRPNDVIVLARYQAIGGCGGTFAATKGGGAVTVSRASTSNSICSDGTWVSAGNSVLPVTDKGAVIWGSIQNIEINSQALASKNPTRASVPTSDDIVAPDGTTTAEALVEDNTAGNTHIIVAPTGANQTAAWTASAFGKANTRTWAFLAFDSNVNGSFFNLSTCAAGNTFGTGVTAGTVLVNNSWCRMWITRNRTSGDSTGRTGMSVAGLSTTYAGDGASSAYFWGLQTRLGAGIAPYVPTAGSPVTKPATDVTVPNPLGETPVDFCATIVATAAWGVTAVGLWSTGAGGGVDVDVTSGQVLTVKTFGEGCDNNTTTWTSAALGLTANAEATFVVCYLPGTHATRAYVNGVEKALTSDSGGTAPDTIGTDVSVGYSYCNGEYLSGSTPRFTVCRYTENPGACL